MINYIYIIYEYVYICSSVTTIYIKRNWLISAFTTWYSEAKASKMATKHVLDILAVYEAGFLWDALKLALLSKML